MLVSLVQEKIQTMNTSNLDHNSKSSVIFLSSSSYDIERNFDN
jgi:hypothetical protein